MDKKTAGIIATVATALLCGCPGLFLCIFGAVTAAGVMPYTTEFNGVVDEGVLPSSYGFVTLCVALIFIAIPIVVGFVMLRNKPEEDVIEASFEEEDIPSGDL